jgi:hypothetical protein
VIRHTFAYFEPDDGAAAGDTPAATPAPATTVPADAVKAVADQIRLAIEAGRTAAAPAAPADTQADSIRALEAESDKIAKDYDQLCAEGRFSEGQALMTRFQQKVNRTVGGDGSNNPTVKVAVALGEKAARVEHKDIMAKWGDEVRRAVDSLPIDERILPDAWDKAISRVKTNHFDEILAAAKTAFIEEHKKSFVPPPSAGGSRSRSLEGAAAKLDEVQLWAADLCGVSPEDYAKSLKFQEDFEKLPLRERGPFDGIPVLTEAKGARIAPGKF